MSTSGAIEAGSAFVKFWGDVSELVGTMKSLGADVKNVTGAISKEVAEKMSGGFATAEAAAAQFGTVATAAGHNVASSMSAAAARTTGVWAGFQRIASSAIGVARASLTFGNIAKTAGIASWGLWGVSRVMRVMGKDTTQIDSITKALWKVSWAARAAAIAVGLIKLPGRVIGGIGSMVGGVGRGIGGLGSRVAGLGGLLAMNSAAASPTEESARPSTTASVAGSALTGFALGGAVGAAVLGLGALIKSTLANSTLQGAVQGTSFMKQFAQSVVEAGKWIANTWGTISKEIAKVFASSKTGGPTVFDRLFQSLFPLVNAVERVWVPAFTNAIKSIAGYFRQGTSDMGQSWSDWIFDSIASVASFIGNIDLYFQMGLETVKLWASNGQVLVGDFFNNFGKWFDWIGKNWQNVLFSMFDLASTIFINIGENLRTVFSKIWDWVKSGFTTKLKLSKDDFKGLTDGYKSAIEDVPQLFTTQLEKTTPEMARIADDISKRREDTEEHRRKRLNKLDFSGGQVKKTKEDLDTKFGAASAQSQEGMSLLAQIQNKSNARDPVAENTKQTVVQLKKVVEEVRQVSEHNRNRFDPLLP